MCVNFWARTQDPQGCLSRQNDDNDSRPGQRLASLPCARPPPVRSGYPWEGFSRLGLFPPRVLARHVLWGARVCGISMYLYMYVRMYIYLYVWGLELCGKMRIMPK